MNNFQKNYDKIIKFITENDFSIFLLVYASWLADTVIRLAGNDNSKPNVSHVSDFGFLFCIFL